jgi:hypothetical protein
MLPYSSDGSSLAFPTALVLEDGIFIASVADPSGAPKSAFNPAKTQ